PRHFHSSVTAGSASLISARILASVLPRQSPSCLILASISWDGDSVFMVSPRSSRNAPAAPPFRGIRQGEHVQTRDEEQGKRKQRRVGDPGRRHPTALSQRDEVGDDRRRESDGQPPVDLSNPCVPVHGTSV